MSDIINELDRLIGQLGMLGELHTAWHPPAALADPELLAAVTSLLETYPFLKRDAGYVAFLQRYGGALLTRDRDGLLLSLFGFSHDIGMHIVEGPGEPITEDGYLILGNMIVPENQAHPGETHSVGLGFDTTGERRWGVYRTVDSGAGTWYCETFLEWLRACIEKDGKLAD
jgi:hypothetical protein